MPGGVWVAVRNFATLRWALLVCAALLAACDTGPKQSRDYASTLQAAGITQLTLAGSNGDVHAIAANVDRIQVHARITTRAMQGLGNDAVTMTRQGNEADIVSNCPEQSVLFFSAQNCEVEYWITYPQSMKASLSLANGDVTVRGPASAIDARTTNGDVTIDGAKGSVTARTTNGDVTIESASSDIAAVSSEGDVSASLASRWAGQQVALKTRFGNVTLRVPQDFRATLHLGTVAGDVRGTQDIPSGNAVVDASTVFGDIDFERSE